WSGPSGSAVVATGWARTIPIPPTLAAARPPATTSTKARRVTCRSQTLLCVARSRPRVIPARFVMCCLVTRKRLGPLRCRAGFVSAIGAARKTKDRERYRPCGFSRMTRPGRGQSPRKNGNGLLYRLRHVDRRQHRMQRSSAGPRPNRRRVARLGSLDQRWRERGEDRFEVALAARVEDVGRKSEGARGLSRVAHLSFGA